MNTCYQFGLMNGTCADDIMGWTYSPPYAQYSLDAGEEDKAELLNGSYYYALKDDNELVGYFCVGSSARVPGGYPAGIYTEESILDIGFGLRPDYTSQGHGPRFYPTSDGLCPREVLFGYAAARCGVFKPAGGSRL